MNKNSYTHAMLLSLQLASIFKYIADLGIHRKTYNQFYSLESENGDIIKVSHSDTDIKGRTKVDVIINNKFKFSQFFNYGVLLELEVNYLTEGNEYRSLLDTIKNETNDTSYLIELIIDLEYSISIFTEYVANNISRL